MYYIIYCFITKKISRERKKLGGGNVGKKKGKLWKKKMPKNCALFQPIKQFDYDLPK